MYLHVTFATNKSHLKLGTNNLSNFEGGMDFPKLQKSLDPPLNLVAVVTNQDVMNVMINAMSVMTQFLSNNGIKNPTNQ